jgi:serine/threonine protein kinase
MNKEKILAKRNVGQVFNERNILMLVGPTPWVIGLTQAFQDETNLYMVTELAYHGDLRALLRNSPGRQVDLEAAKFYIVCVLMGLEFLHSLGIVHRDVKPDNILIKADGYATLGDLGIAKEMDTNGLVYGRSGTSSYMPLESFRAPYATSANTDVFGLGVTFHEIVNGRKPFERGALRAYAKSQEANRGQLVDDSSILMSILRMSEPTSLPLIYSMLQLDAAYRISAKEALAHPVLASVEPSTIRSRKKRAPDLQQPTTESGSIRRKQQRRSVTVTNRATSMQTTSSFRHVRSADGDPFEGFEYDCAAVQTKTSKTISSRISSQLSAEEQRITSGGILERRIAVQ